MKKLIAILLAVLMCSSALIAVSAAEETEPAATVPAVAEAPRFVGAQYADNGDGTHNVRFVSVINNSAGDKLGFEITAHFINKAGRGIAYKYPAEETEGVRVFEQIYDAGDLVSATDPKYNGAYFYVYVLEGVPTDYDVFFETTAYLVNGEEKLCADTEFVNFSNGVTNPMTMGEKQTYDYVEKSTALSAFGIPGSYADGYNDEETDSGIYVKDGKLNIGRISWKSGASYQPYLLQVMSAETLGNALRKDDGSYHKSYVFEADVSLTPTTSSNFYFVFNGDSSTGTWSDNSSNAHALGTGLQCRTAGTLKVMTGGWMEGSSGTIKQNIYQYSSTTHTYTNTASFKLTIAVSEGGRTDLYINGAWKAYGTSTDTTDADLKVTEGGTMLSNIMLWAQDTPAKLDNITIKVDATGTEGEIVSKLDKLTTTYYEDFYDVEGEYGVDRPITAKNYGSSTYITSQGKLLVNGGGWNNNFITVADSTTMNLNGTTTFIVDADINVTKLGTFSLYFDEFDENTAFTTANGSAVRIEKSGTDAVVWYRCFDSDNYGATNPTKVTFMEDANFTNLSFSIRIIVNGTTYSVYIDGKHCISAELPAAVVATNNTAFMLWAQDTDLTLDNLQITTLRTN